MLRILHNLTKATLKPFNLFSITPIQFFSNQTPPKDPSEQSSPLKPSKKRRKSFVSSNFQKPTILSAPLPAPQFPPQDKPIKIFTPKKTPVENDDYFNSAKKSDKILDDDLKDYLSVPQSLSRGPFEKQPKLQQEARTHKKDYKKPDLLVVKDHLDEPRKSPRTDFRRRRIDDSNLKQQMEKKPEMKIFGGASKSADLQEKTPKKNIFAAPQPNMFQAKRQENEKNEKIHSMMSETDVHEYGEDHEVMDEGIEQTSETIKPIKIFNFQEKNKENEFKSSQQTSKQKKIFKRDESSAKGPKIFNFSQQPSKMEEFTDFDTKPIEKKEFRPIVPNTFKRGSVLSAITGKTVHIKKPEKKEKKEKKPVLPPNYKEIIEKLWNSDKNHKNEENAYFSALLFSRNQLLLSRDIEKKIQFDQQKAELDKEYKRIKANFYRINSLDRLPLISSNIIHQYYFLLIENEDIDGLNSLYQALCKAKYDFSSINITALLDIFTDVSDTQFLQKLHLYLAYLTFFKPSLKKAKENKLNSLKTNALFRNLIKIIDLSDPKTQPFMDLSYTFVEILMRKQILNEFTIEPSDLSKWFELNLLNNQSLGLLCNVAGQYSNRNLIDSFKTSLKEFIEREGYIPYNREQIEEKYLEIKEKILKAPKASGLNYPHNSLELLLLAADRHKINEITLDLYSNVSVLKTVKNMKIEFIFDWMLELVPTLELAHSNYRNIIKKIIIQRAKQIKNKPKFQPDKMILIKACIKDGDYKEAKESFFNEIYRSQVISYEQKKLNVFFELIIKQDKKVVGKLNQIRSSLSNLQNYLHNNFFFDLFYKEQNDRSIESLYKYPRDLFAKNEKEIEVFKFLLKKFDGSLDKIKEFIKSRDKSYDKDLHVKYYEILDKFQKVSSIALSEEQKNVESIDLLKEYLTFGYRVTRDDEDEDIPEKGDNSEENVEELKNSETKKEEKVVKKGKVKRPRFKRLEYHKSRIAYYLKPDRKLSKNAQISEKLGYLAAHKKICEKEENLKLRKKFYENTKNSDLFKLNKNNITSFITKRMGFYRSLDKYVRVQLNNQVKQEIYDLIAWGVHNNEPFAIYLCEKLCEMFKVKIPQYLTRQINIFLDYSNNKQSSTINSLYLLHSFKGELSNKFIKARENIEDIDRGTIYPSDSEYNFIGAPKDYIPSINYLNKDPRFRDFAERKTREFPITLSQKFGFEPEWSRNLKKMNQSSKITI